MYAFVNNKILPAEKAFLHVSDLSVQRGFGVFDFFKIKDGHPYFLTDYLDRFYRSAEIMHLPVGLKREEMIYAIRELIKKNASLKESGMKILLTGGYSSDGYTPGRPNLIMTQHPLVLPPKEQLETGVKIITHEYVRDIPEVKTINYTMGIWLINRIKEHNAYDVLYKKDGRVSEFPRSNFFVVRNDNVVLTPKDHVLAGITRKNLLEIGHDEFQAQEAEVRFEDVITAKEAFITSTTKRLVPIVNVDGHRIGNGKPGEVTQALLQRLIALEIADENRVHH
jgi:branched-chain amino acid aminotransferase